MCICRFLICILTIHCIKIILAQNLVRIVNFIYLVSDEDQVSVVFLDELSEDRTDKEIRNFVSHHSISSSTIVG